MYMLLTYIATSHIYMLLSLVPRGSSNGSRDTCSARPTHYFSPFSSVGLPKKLSGRRDTISPAACQPSYSCTVGLHSPYIEPGRWLVARVIESLSDYLRNSMLTAPDRAPYVVLGMLLSACQWSLSLADTSLIHLLVHIFFTWLSYLHSWSSSSIVIVLGFKSESSV
jgi:hypothetical protein